MLINWIGLAVVAAVAITLVVRDYWLGYLPWPQVIRTRDLNRLAEKNLLVDAKHSVLVFSGALQRDLGAHPVLCEQVRERKGCEVEFLVGPDVCIGATDMLAAIKANPQIRLFLMREEVRDRLQIPGDPPRWRYRHYLVADDRHVNVEARHTIPMPRKRHPRQIEARNVPQLARYYRHRFDVFRRAFAVEIDKDRLVEGIRRHGRFVVAEDDTSRPATDAEVAELAFKLGEAAGSAA